MNDDMKTRGIAAVTDLAQFRQKKPDLVFQCSCGSQHFYLVYNAKYPGQLQCRECERFLESMVWGIRE